MEARSRAKRFVRAVALLTARNTRAWFRQKTAAFLLLGLPLIYFLFSVQATLAVDANVRAPVEVDAIDPSMASYATDFRAFLAHSTTFVVGDGPSFAARFHLAPATTNTSAFIVTIDASSAQTLANAREAVEHFELSERAGATTSPRFAIQATTIPSAGNRVFASVLVFGIIWSAIPGAATIPQRDARTGYRARVRQMGATTAAILLSDVLQYLIVLFLQLGLLIAFGTLWYGLDVHGILLTLLAAVVLGILSFVAIGTLIGTLAPDPQTASAFATFSAFTLMILTGAGSALGKIPGQEAIAKVLPIARVVPTIDRVMLMGASFADVAADLAWLAAFTSALLVIAIATASRSRAEAA